MNEINVAGKIAIKLEENKHIIYKKLVIVVCEKKLVIYQIEKKLNKKEKKMIETDFENALKKWSIRRKLREGGPIMVTNGEMYYDDLAVIKGGKDQMVYIAIF